MDIIDIENLTVDQIKAQGPDIVAALSKDPPPALPQRYVTALTTAKLRDEKMDEQGKTIGALQDALEASKTQNAELAQARDTAVEAGAQAQIAIQSAEAAVAELTSTRQGLLAEAAKTAQAVDELTVQNADLAQVSADTAADNAVVRTALADTAARCERLKAAAHRNNLALTVAAKALNDALGHNAVDEADQPAA